MDFLGEKLFAVSPYEGFDPSGYRYDVQGWNSESPVFHELIDETSPRLIIEVGAWKGASAIHMGKYLKNKNPGARILCVDTWLGSLDFFKEKNPLWRSKFLNTRHGYPTVYFQFIYNVIHSGLTEMILPFPQTSFLASRWLAHEKLRAGMIYIDGSHEEADVASDLENYFELLETGGVLFGDDYSGASPGVRRAVERFSALNNLKMELRDKQFWIFRKK